MSTTKQISGIKAEELRYEDGTTLVGQDNTPGLSAHEMQMSVENLGRNVLIPKVNEIINELNETYSKDETDKAINNKVTELGAGDMAKSQYDPAGDVLSAGGIAAYTAAASSLNMAKSQYDPAGDVLAAGGIAAYTAAASSLKMDLLWTNASPTSAFAEQIINLGIDLSRYNYLLFEWHEYISYENCFYSQITGYNAGLVTVSTSNNSWRTYFVQANNSILFQNAYLNNSYMIPIRIWGVR